MPASPSPKAARSILALLALAAAAGFIVHLGLGSTSFVSPLGVVAEIFRGPKNDTQANTIVWFIRMPRALGCLLIGATLGAVGSAFQGLFRNPLAEPYIVGVSSGAAVGGVVAETIGIGGAIGGLAQAGLAFAGGLLSLLLVLGLAGKRGQTNVTTLLLAGVVVGAMLAAVLSVLILLGGQDANRLMFWLLGDTSHVQLPSVWLLVATLAAGLPILVSQARNLNAFAVGEDTARRLGVNTKRLKAVVLVTGTAMASIVVGVAGVIAFIGLVAPHIARSILGVDWRRSLAASAIIGAILLLVADAIAQRASAFSVAWLPVGAITALIGAPSLLILLRRSA